MVLARGERDAGTVLVVTIGHGQPACLYERMPRPDGSRPFIAAKRENPENRQEFSEYLDRRRRQDPDLWLIELDIPGAERFIASWGS